MLASELVIVSVVVVVAVVVVVVVVVGVRVVPEVADITVFVLHDTLVDVFGCFLHVGVAAAFGRGLEPALISCSERCEGGFRM